MGEAARRRARDSGTLSGTSAEEERRRGRSCRCASGAQARSRPLADAFLSSPRYVNRNTHRGYAGNPGHWRLATDSDSSPVALHAISAVRRGTGSLGTPQFEARRTVILRWSRRFHGLVLGPGSDSAIQLRTAIAEHRLWNDFRERSAGGSRTGRTHRDNCSRSKAAEQGRLHELLQEQEYCPCGGCCG